VLDNLREGVLTPDIYDPTLNPLYRDVLAHYGAVALPCRVREAAYYGAPPGWIGRRVQVQWDARNVWLLDPRARQHAADIEPPGGRLGKLLGDVAAVTAMLDRILHHGYALKCARAAGARKRRRPLPEALSDSKCPSPSRGSAPSPAGASPLRPD
jgi:hypothetical protein